MSEFGPKPANEHPRETIVRLPEGRLFHVKKNDDGITEAHQVSKKGEEVTLPIDISRKGTEKAVVKFDGKKYKGRITPTVTNAGREIELITTEGKRRKFLPAIWRLLNDQPTSHREHQARKTLLDGQGVASPYATIIPKGGDVIPGSKSAEEAAAYELFRRTQNQPPKGK